MRSKEKEPKEPNPKKPAARKPAARKPKEVKEHALPTAPIVEKRSRRPAEAGQKYGFCYVQPSEEDVLEAQREMALRDAEVRPNPSGCARAEPRTNSDEAERARVTRSLVQAAKDRKQKTPQPEMRPEEEDDLEPQQKPKSTSSTRGGGLVPKKAHTTIRSTSSVSQNLFKYRQMKATPMSDSLEVRRSHIHGWGLFLKKDIKKDDFIVEYLGQIVRQLVGDKREKYYEDAGVGSCYLFRLDEHHIVDATRRGNIGRFMNHCCKPNVRFFLSFLTFLS